MAYICNDCGNKSSQKFPGGKCPACDSFNIKSTQTSTRQAINDKEPKTMFELLIMFLLWGALAYGFWDRYLRTDTPSPAPQATGMSKMLEDKMHLNKAPGNEY